MKTLKFNLVIRKKNISQRRRISHMFQYRAYATSTQHFIIQSPNEDDLENLKNNYNYQISNFETESKFDDIIEDFDPTANKLEIKESKEGKTILELTKKENLKEEFLNCKTDIYQWLTD